MSARTILDNDFEFNNLHLNKLQFSDNSVQQTAYLGNSPLPSQVIYPITTSTILYCNNGLTATSTTDFNIVNLHTGFISVLYFQDLTLNNITSINLNFSNTFYGDLEITLLSSVNSPPYYTSNFASSITNINTGTLTFGNLNINKNGSLTVSFNNITINNNTYTLSLFSYIYV
jgi:hypothetical protein